MSYLQKVPFSQSPFMRFTEEFGRINDGSLIPVEEMKGDELSDGLTDKSIRWCQIFSLPFLILESIFFPPKAQPINSFFV